MPAPALLCAATEVALNRYLRLEPAALADCARLSGQRIGLKLSDFGWTFTIEFCETGVRMLSDEGLTADASLAAASPRLLAMALRAMNAESEPSFAGLRVGGDAELLRRFSALIQRVGFDAEELLAPLIAPAFGEGAVHRVVGALRSAAGWGRFAAGRLEQDAAEYLREETHDLAQPAAVEEWMDAVDRLRERTDRAEARLALLEAGRRA